MNDKRDDYVRPMDEAAKQIFRNDPDMAMQTEGLGVLLFLGVLVVSVILCLIVNALG